MMKCTSCRKEKNIVDFTKGEKVLKKCLCCREKVAEWKEKNAERVSLYNKMYNDKNKNQEDKIMILAKKVKDEEWTEYISQADAAKCLKLCTPNINKVIKGHLKTTGGYEFKIKTVTAEKIDVPSWEQIKEDNDFGDKVKGQPSNHRIIHEEKDNIMGKNCCTCKEWFPLTDYNFSKEHWDKLRVDCKKCLSNWRKNNRKQLTQKQLIYEKNRKLNDPAFTPLNI